MCKAIGIEARNKSKLKTTCTNIKTVITLKFETSVIMGSTVRKPP